MGGIMEIGTVSHYYDHIGVAVVKLSKPLKIGDKIQVKGHTTDFKQKVESMQIEHDKITEAKKGQEIGLKVAEKVRQNDKILKT